MTAASLGDFEKGVLPFPALFKRGELGAFEEAPHVSGKLFEKEKRSYEEVPRTDPHPCHGPVPGRLRRQRRQQ